MGPRIFCIPATDASVVAVIRRGPSGWCHLGRWDPGAGTYEPGSWIRGVIYPQRCDLSPDGRWFASFVLKGSIRADWTPGATYVAISRLPWLTALAGWGTGGTWTRGMAIVRRGTAAFRPGPPDAGDPAPLLARYDLELGRPASYAVELARGWAETSDSPPRSDDDPWDVRRAERLEVEKPRPRASGGRLLVAGGYAAHREGQPVQGGVRYRFDGPGGVRPLEGIQWADWAPDGRLLVATAAGELQVRDEPRDAEPSWRRDLAGMTPSPAEPPPDARAW